MKRVYFVLLLIQVVTITKCFGQAETDKWYFGYNTGLDFSSGVPVNFTGSQMNQFEGSASISDTSGNLLFYTDGMTVWNHNNNIMVNGTGLFGGSSSTQSALIVPLPGSDSIYYVFTTSNQLAPGGFCYSIVDMTLQSGDGEVTDKNIELLSVGTEKITAVCHANGTDLWVITHDYNNNNFLAYQLSASGLNTTPVTSSAGYATGSSDQNVIGYLKGSFDGTKLAQAVYGDNYFELFDFDKTTGVVSNAIHLTSFPTAVYGAYGVEFSPNGSRLYGTVVSPGIVFQWNLNAGSATDIENSKTVLYSSSTEYNGALQLASDGKIYEAISGSLFLGVINDPDSLPISCNYVHQGYNLVYGSSSYGLPNIYPCYLSPNMGPVSNFTALDTSLCEKFCMDFTDASSNGPSSWEWIFEGGIPSTSTSQNPVNICYQLPGVFDVTLITTNSNGTDTLTLADYITVHSTPPFPDITQSGYTLTSSPAVTYQWQFNSVDIPGATNQSYDAQQTGYYTVVISDEFGCVTSGTVYILIEGVDESNNDANVFIYPNPSKGNFIIEWLNGSMADWLTIEVHNVIGQSIFSSSEKIPSGVLSKEISLENTIPGVYFVDVKLEDVLIRKKLIISK